MTAYSHSVDSGTLGAVVPALERMGSELLLDAGDSVMRLHRATGFPVFLVHWPDVARDDALAWWTSTNLAVIRVANVVSDEPLLRRRVRARLALLEQHALGLPLRAVTDDHASLRLSESSVTTAGLIRAVASVPAIHAESLSDEAAMCIEELWLALSRKDDVTLALPLPRLAALLVAAGLRGGCTKSDEQALHRIWSGLSRAVNAIRSAAPVVAANTAWRWAMRTGVVPRWTMADPRNAEVQVPRVRVLSAAASGVFATDELNLKGWRFTPDELRNLTERTRQRPLIYFDHDRSRPPGVIALDVAFHCHGAGRHDGSIRGDYKCDGKEGYHVSIVVAARSKEGVARLERGGGFSVGVDLVPARTM